MGAWAPLLASAGGARERQAGPPFWGLRHIAVIGDAPQPKNPTGLKRVNTAGALIFTLLAMEDEGDVTGTTDSWCGVPA